MASYGFRRSLKVLFHRPVKICGSFTAANPPVIQTGNGFTVSRSGTGDYVVTYTTKAGSFVSGQVTMTHTAETVANFKQAPTTSSAEILVYNAAGAAADQGTVNFSLIITEGAQLH